MIAFWDKARRGANGFNGATTPDWWRAAHGAGLEWVRLAPDKWRKAPGQRDFLLGNADRFAGLVPADLKRLISCLDDAHSAEMPVVLTLLSLPGARWRQFNGDKSDPKLWRDPAFLKSAERCWSELARALKGHPALVGYDPLNEPHPKNIPGSSLSVNGFYERLIPAIRSVDGKIPIFLESDDYASPAEFGKLAPLHDPAILYTFHLYDPWEFTSGSKEKFRYPDRMPGGFVSVENYLKPVRTWQKRHSIAANRIVAAEYGCRRKAPGAALWLRDATDALEKENWHRAFYSFREDTWNGMDYEIGTASLPEAYWKAQEAGRPMAPPRPRDTPHWAALKLPPGKEKR